MSRFFILRPIFTSMIMLIVVVLGAVCISRLPIDLVPDVSIPTLTVSTSYAGAGPEEIEELISRPIEEAVGAAPGVEEVTSTSSEGSSRVRVTFTTGSDLTEAANELRERIDRLLARLPEDADRPQLLKFDVAATPIVILAAESDLDPLDTRVLIDTEIKNRLERVPGVASLDVLGGLVREIHIDLDLDRLQSLQIPFNQMVSALQAANIQIPAGTIATGGKDVLVRTPGEYRSLREIMNTVVATRDGIPIRLSQLATVKDAFQRRTNKVRIDGLDGIRLAIRKQSGTNTVAVADGAIEAVERVNRELPQIRLKVLVDTSAFIRNSLWNVATSVMYGGVLAIVILYFFLGNVRATLVIATAIPISVVGTFILMYFANFTLNVITLSGLALGVGMLVDNAIVVLENIFRNREEGKPYLEAAITGSQQVTAAIIASTLTTIAVFLPLVFVQGVSGVTYQVLGYIVGFSLVCSLAMALTLVPMLTALMMGGRKPMQMNARRPFLQWLDRSYQKTLRLALTARWVVLPVVLLVFGLSLFLARGIGVEFMPEADEGEVRVTAEMEVGTRLEVIEERMKKVEEIVRQEVPEARSILSEIGASGFGGPSNPSSGQVRIYLPKLSERKRTTMQIANDLRQPLMGLPGMTIRTRAASSFFALRIVSGSGGSERVQIEVRGYDFDTAGRLAQQVSDTVAQIDGVSDTQISRVSGNPEQSIVVDRDKAADLGVSVSDVGRALQTVLTGSLANTYRISGKEYDIRVKVADAEFKRLDDLLRMTVANAEGEAVMLANLVKVETRTGPVSIERKDQERIINVAANVADRPLNAVLEDVEAAIREIPTPTDFSILLAGDIEEQQKSFRDLLVGLLLSLALIYMIMAAQYESLLYPFVVMFSVPLSAIGVVAALLLTHTTFNLQSFIGVIMLGGIVVNNAIVLVDQINQLRREDGMELRAAIEEAGFRRLRPILMTTLTTLLGLLPLALGLGEGSETQAPMARTVIGGLTSSTFLTLFVVPIMYYLLETLRLRFFPPPAPIGADLAVQPVEASHV